MCINSVETFFFLSQKYQKWIYQVLEMSLFNYVKSHKYNIWVRLPITNKIWLSYRPIHLHICVIARACFCVDMCINLFCVHVGDSGVPGIPRQGGQAAASINFSDGGGGGGYKLEKCQIFLRASRAKSQYLTFRAKRAAKMKIVYV